MIQKGVVTIEICNNNHPITRYLIKLKYWFSDYFQEFGSVGLRTPLTAKWLMCFDKLEILEICSNGVLLTEFDAKANPLSFL